MTEDRIGIVIQGPLISTGRSGRTAHIPFSKVKSEDVVDFACVPLIARLFKSYGQQYDMICVVWDSEPDNIKQELQKVLPPDSVHLIKDDTKELPEYGQVIPGNNKYRQIRSSLAGFEILSARGCTHIAKIRSDQEVDIDKLVLDYMSLRNSGNLLVPRFNPTTPDFLADFFFMGEAKQMLRLFRAYLNTPELFKSVHHDLFYCWGRELVGPPFWPFWLRNSRLYSGYIRKVWANFTPASRSLYEGLVWRGESWPNRVSQDIFLDDLNGKVPTDYIDKSGQRTIASIIVTRVASRLRRNLSLLKRKVFLM